MSLRLICENGVNRKREVGLKHLFYSGIMDSSATEEITGKILNLLNANPKGISDSDITQNIPELSPTHKVTIINKLLQQGNIQLFNQGGLLIYRLKDPTTKNTVKGADNEEKVVYSIIEEAGNKGIWIRDIRFKSNLIMTQLNKILKNLENKKLIKAVKSVNASKKKVYMLMNLEPDRSLTGGAWYQDQDFESEFVDVLNQQCHRFLQQRSENSRNNPAGPLVARTLAYATAKDVHKFITDLGISKVSLDVEDLETILNTLVYDGKAEKTVSPDGNTLYRSIQSLLPPPGIVRTPCGVCPLIHKCSCSGLITPKTCTYISEWLE